MKAGAFGPNCAGGDFRVETDVEWHDWKRLLGTAVHAAKAVGVPDRYIEEVAYRIGGVLADHFDPGNREQRLIKELWEQGNEGEKRALAALFARMLDNDTGRPGPADTARQSDTH